MARKKKRKLSLSAREQRRMRTQQIIFSLIAIIVIASFVVSLIAT